MPSRRGSKDVLTDEDISQLGKVVTELSNSLWRSLNLLALCILARSLLLSVESQVLQQDNLSILSIVDNRLDLWSDAVRRKGDLAAEQLLELRHDWLERVLLDDLAIWTAQVGHEDDRLGAVVDRILDGWDGTSDTLGVGDVLVGVERDVEVDLIAESGSVSVHFSHLLRHCDGAGQLTLMRTLLSLTDTSVSESLLERDIFARQLQFSKILKQLKYFENLKEQMEIDIDENRRTVSTIMGV